MKYSAPLFLTAIFLATCIANSAVIGGPKADPDNESLRSTLIRIARQASAAQDPEEGKRLFKSMFKVIASSKESKHQKKMLTKELLRNFRSSKKSARKIRRSEEQQKVVFGQSCEELLIAEQENERILREAAADRAKRLDDSALPSDERPIEDHAPDSALMGQSQIHMSYSSSSSRTYSSPTGSSSSHSSAVSAPVFSFLGPVSPLDELVSEGDSKLAASTGHSTSTVTVASQNSQPRPKPKSWEQLNERYARLQTSYSQNALEQHRANQEIERRCFFSSLWPAGYRFVDVNSTTASQVNQLHATSASTSAGASSAVPLPSVVYSSEPVLSATVTTTGSAPATISPATTAAAPAHSGAILIGDVKGIYGRQMGMLDGLLWERGKFRDILSVIIRYDPWEISFPRVVEVAKALNLSTSIQTKYETYTTFCVNSRAIFNSISWIIEHTFSLVLGSQQAVKIHLETPRESSAGRMINYSAKDASSGTYIPPVWLFLWNFDFTDYRADNRGERFISATLRGEHPHLWMPKSDQSQDDSMKMDHKKD